MGRPRVRGKILVAAQELLSQQGMTGLTTRGVADKAGVTEASVFNNFGDKAGLIQSLLREQMSEFSAFSDALARPAEPDLAAWLGEVFLTARNFFRVVLPLAGPQLSRGRQAKTSRSQDQYMGHSALATRLREFQIAGVIAATADIEAVALLLMGSAMHSALTAATLGDDALGGDASLVQRVAGTLYLLINPSP